MPRKPDPLESEIERAPGLAADWKRTVDRVRADHARKTGFMPGFERLSAGRGPGGEPSFLERANTHWADRQRRRK